MILLSSNFITIDVYELKFTLCNMLISRGLISFNSVYSTFDFITFVQWSSYELGKSRFVSPLVLQHAFFHSPFPIHPTWSLHLLLAIAIGILFSILVGVVVYIWKCQSFPSPPPAGDLSCYNYKKKNPSSLCCLLVDSGYSFTHIVPYMKGKKLKQGIRRIDVGGKMLTNHLKEIISYRYCELSKFTWAV
jgi:hypothetical protein